MDGGASIPIGGTFTYASPSGAVAPTATVTNGGWHITLTAPGMATAPQYVGVGIYFNGNAAGDACVDGTAYTGVKFDITGTIGATGCTAQFSINDSEHSDAVANSTDKKAGGPMGAYAPQTTLTVVDHPDGDGSIHGPDGRQPGHGRRQDEADRRAVAVHGRRRLRRACARSTSSSTTSVSTRPTQP